MRNITIQLPDNVDVTAKQATTYLAAKLYEAGKLTMGQAAEIAGYSKRTFMEILADYGVSIFNYSPEELDRDLENARKHHK